MHILAQLFSGYIDFLYYRDSLTHIGLIENI